MSVPRFKLIALKLLSYALETEFDLCELSDLENKVLTPKQIGFPMGLWGSYIPSINMIAVKPFE